ncbi:hypothetical protein V1477_014785 [Vespula maculifrons]|uniref:Uncharacterized protein n=1 Tax=Vespula maculifrons TaxID=7453 RepID=A0ABD2BIG7_VESMC
MNGSGPTSITFHQHSTILYFEDSSSESTTLKLYLFVFLFFFVSSRKYNRNTIELDHQEVKKERKKEKQIYTELGW